MHKKAQITLFIILALAILITMGMYIYLSSTSELRKLEQKRPALTQAPLQFSPIIDYVNDCLSHLEKDALIHLGEQGGYLDTSSITPNPFEPTEGEGVEFAPGSNVIVPYWWHLKDKNTCEGTCTFESKRLPLERGAGKISVAGQIDTYIEKNLDTCLQNFTSFKNKNYRFETKEKPIAETTIAREDVFVVLHYPITITKSDQSYHHETFYASIPLNLREIYDAATHITNLEAQHTYLEKNIRELIDAFSRLDKNSLPPVSDLKFGLDIGTIWIKIEVEQKIQQILASYLPLLQTAGTRGHRYIKAPEHVKDKLLFETLYNRGMILPLEQDYPSLTIQHTYLDWWKPYIDISGCRGQICQPESMGTTFGFIFGIQRYNFAYDVSIPVLVEINNPTAFDGEGYTFNFALEANMRNNRPMPAEFKPLRPLAQTTVPSMLCDEDKRDGGTLQLTLTDGRSGKNVEDAVIAYTCGTESCNLGTTKKGRLETNLPHCLGGVISAEKYDHHPTFVPLDTYTGENQTVTSVIEPYRLFEFSVKKYLLKKGVAWSVDTDNLMPQSHDEQTIITLERKTHPYEEPFTAFAEVYGNKLSPQQDYSQEIRLIPGSYTAKLYTIKYPQQPLSIPKEKRCFKGGILGEKKECVFVPEQDLVFTQEKPLPLGGAEFEWNVTAASLDKSKEIEWKILSIGLDRIPEEQRKIEDLDEIGKIEAHSQEIKNELQPVLK